MNKILSVLIRLAVIVFAVGCIFAVVGYMSLSPVSTNKQDTVSSAQQSTVYIGDNSKVLAVVDELPYPQGIQRSTIEIQSASEPYELKVFLTSAPQKADMLQASADQAFENISNMGIISFYENTSGRLIASYTRA